MSTPCYVTRYPWRNLRRATPLADLNSAWDWLCYRHETASWGCLLGQETAAHLLGNRNPLDLYGYRDVGSYDLASLQRLLERRWVYLALHQDFNLPTGLIWFFRAGAHALEGPGVPPIVYTLVV